MKFATRYVPPVSPAVKFKNPTMTDQSFKSECDINVIVSRCMQTGVVPTVEGGIYADFADLPNDLQSSYELIEEAGNRFMQLSSDIRKEFNNDPMQLLSFLHNPANRQRAGELGLIDVPPSPPAPNVSLKETNVVNDPPDKGES